MAKMTDEDRYLESLMPSEATQAQTRTEQERHYAEVAAQAQADCDAMEDAGMAWPGAKGERSAAARSCSLTFCGPGR